MASDSAFRASDADRDRVVEVLRDAYATGRLSLAEFQERVTSALTGRTWGELRALTSDLPVSERTPQPVLVRAFPPRGRAGPLPVLPLAMLWLLASLSVHAPIAFIPAVFLLMSGMWLSAARMRGRPGCAGFADGRGTGSRRPRGAAGASPGPPGGARVQQAQGGCCPAGVSRQRPAGAVQWDAARLICGGSRPAGAVQWDAARLICGGSRPAAARSSRTSVR